MKDITMNDIKTMIVSVGVIHPEELASTKEKAKLIPDSMTQGKNAIQALKHFKESAGR